MKGAHSLNLYAMPSTDSDTFSVKVLQCVSILSSHLGNGVLNEYIPKVTLGIYPSLP